MGGIWVRVSHEERKRHDRPRFAATVCLDQHRIGETRTHSYDRDCAKNLILHTIPVLEYLAGWILRRQINGRVAAG